MKQFLKSQAAGSAILLLLLCLSSLTQCQQETRELLSVRDTIHVYDEEGREIDQMEMWPFPFLEHVRVG